MKFGDEFVKKHSLSTLKVSLMICLTLVFSMTCEESRTSWRIFQVLGSVGEPINSEAWLWFYNLIGHGKCSISDTFWQTETGGHVITPLPGATPMKPGSAVSNSFPNNFLLSITYF